MSDWKVGDIVLLKSGGPEMTVSEVTQSMVSCVWFDGSKKLEGAFAAAMLESKSTAEARWAAIEREQTARMRAYEQGH